VNPRGEAGAEEAAPRVFRGGSWVDGPRWLHAAYRDSWHRDWCDINRGFRLLLRSTSPGAERLPEALAAPEGPQGESPAPGRGRGAGGGGVSPARRPAGPATWADRIKAWVLGEKGPDSNKGD